ncbi:hypothetical protein [Aquimarina agarilytica]|uniref:hypothetical protein n=1 Tax=Aquimarina agarilytica TaxID=1087449 RepID=UPI00028A3AB0|nr:hypothetical protein [Aquimarina agarilytica]
MNKLSIKLIVNCSLLLFTVNSFSQNIPLKNENTRKGKLYFYWGWNGASYSKSTIKFEGDEYNFELKDVVGKDRQTKFSVGKYFNPGSITIPQYNFRIGYYFKDNWDISFGIDHMKYVVQQNQRVKIAGAINGTETIYDGVYSNDDITIQEGFLEFEHTDGLNFVNFEIRRSDQILNLNKVSLNLTGGLGAGILYPKTNATLINKPRYDDFHVSGFGIDAIVGLNVTFFKRFFVQTEFKSGYINMPSIRTTLSSADKASQSFFFFQRNIVFGGIFNLTKASKIKKK